MLDTANNFSDRPVWSMLYKDFKFQPAHPSTEVRKHSSLEYFFVRSSCSQSDLLHQTCIISGYLFWLLLTRGLSGTLEIRFTGTFHTSHSALHFLPFCWPYVTKIGAAVFSVQILSQKLPKSMSFKKQDKKCGTSTTFPWRTLWWSRRRRELRRRTWDSVFRLFLVTIQTSFFR